MEKACYGGNMKVGLSSEGAHCLSILICCNYQIVVRSGVTYVVDCLWLMRDL